MTLPRTTTLAVLLLCACGGPESRDDAMGASDLPLLSVGAPTLEIGVMEGDEDYALVDVARALRLADGSVAVADAGVNRISVFDQSGAFLRAFGSRGQGPGEFRGLSRIYPHGADSLFALDAWTGRVSVFDIEGAFARQTEARAMSGDSVFALDVWLHSRFWVDGVMDPDERAALKATLDRLPPPRSTPGYRLVRVAESGELWIREPLLDASGMRTWTVTDASGKPTGVLLLPERFEPQHIRGDEVLGRWRGEADVNFVRAYTLESTGETRPIPGWFSGAESDVTSTEPTEAAEFLALIRGAVKSMASQQEIWYSTHMTYTSMIDSLEWEPAEGLQVDFVSATSRGWTGVFTHSSIDRICGLGYGSTVPPGWAPGSIICAPAPAEVLGGN